MRVPVATCSCLLLVTAARADIITLNPIADAFVDSAIPAGNFGGGGGLAVAAPGLPQGEFQTALRFDASSAVASFNATFGPGNWTIQAVSLQLTATAPNSPVFNAQAAGQFAASWMQNDSWVEGTGTPAAPGASGLTFATLPSFLSGADEGLGTLSFGGATSGASTYALALTSGFNADLAAGSLVSMRLSGVGSTLGYVFNSRNFGTVSARPALSITAVPTPGAGTILALTGCAAVRRRRRA